MSFKSIKFHKSYRRGRSEYCCYHLFDDEFGLEKIFLKDADDEATAVLLAYHKRHLSCAKNLALYYIYIDEHDNEFYIAEQDHFIKRYLKDHFLEYSDLLKRWSTIKKDKDKYIKQYVVFI